GSRARWRAVDVSQRGDMDEPDPESPGERATRLGVDAPRGHHPATAAPARDAGRSGGPGRLQQGGLAGQLAAVGAAHPSADIARGAEDEHRLGLLPIRRRIWAPKGQRPSAPVERHYDWLYVYGFVRPRTGQRWWCLLPRVTTEAFALALAAFARDEG